MSEITLFIPDLYAETAGDMQGGFDRSRWPNIWALCARAKFSELPILSGEEQLCSLFGSTTDADAMFAPAALSANLDLAADKAGSGGLMRADPIHLRADPNQILLFNDPDIMPNLVEADALLAELNRGFDDLEFYRGDHPSRWYCNTLEQPRTYPATAVAGRSIAPFLPRGEGAADLQRIMNDAQMLLHDCAVNVERETRGLPAINSIWLWGGQRNLPALRPVVDRVVGDDVLLGAIAAETGIAWMRNQSCSEILTTQTSSSRTLVVFGAPNGTVQASAEAFSLDAFERTWAMPLVAALRRCKLSQLTIISDRESYSIRPWDLFKLWRTSLERVA